MKKIYLIPQTQVTEIELQQMIAESIIEKTLNPEETTDDPNEIGSRRYQNVWDDEEEEF